MVSKIFYSAVALAAVAQAQNCTLQFEGRVPAGSTPQSFDADTSNFSPTNVFGQNLTWGEIVELPAITPSLFDAKAGTIPVAITLSDASIFAPSADNVQIGFRRAEFLPASNNGTDPSTTGVKTLHFSMQKDAARPFNLSHEYQMVFLESADFSTNQFVLKTGTIGGVTGDPDTLVLQSNVKNATTLFSTAFTADTWHNFGVVLDFDANTTQVLYSTNNDALAAVTEPLANDISGQGQYHFGALKKPTGEGLTDVTKQGDQEAGISEAIFYGGIFMEDSACGCVSLS